MTGDVLDARLGAGKLIINSRSTAPVHPRLVIMRVIADLVAAPGDFGEDVGVHRHCRVLADDEKGDSEIELIENLEYARNEQIEIRRHRLPCRISMRLHVRPLIVQVEREGGLHATAASGELTGSARSCAVTRFARPTVSFTLSVPLTICALLAMKRPRVAVRVGGNRCE